MVGCQRSTTLVSCRVSGGSGNETSTTIDNRILTYGLETAYTRHVFMLFADHVMFAKQQPILLFASTGTEHFRAPPPYSHPPCKR